METSASFEARSAPSPYPTRLSIHVGVSNEPARTKSGQISSDRAESNRPIGFFSDETARNGAAHPLESRDDPTSGSDEIDHFSDGKNVQIPTSRSPCPIA